MEYGWLPINCQAENTHKEYRMKTHRLLLAAVLIPASSLVLAQNYAGDAGSPSHSSFGEKEYSPYLDIGYPQRVFWGDTHVHTALRGHPDEG